MKNYGIYIKMTSKSTIDLVNRYKVLKSLRYVTFSRTPLPLCHTLSQISKIFIFCLVNWPNAPREIQQKW